MGNKVMIVPETIFPVIRILRHIMIQQIQDTADPETPRHGFDDDLLVFHR